jgi:hypothetical protein
MFLGVCRSGIYFSESVMYIGISGYCRPYIDTNGRGINQLDLGNAVCLYLLHMGRQLLSADFSPQGGNQTFQDHGRFSGSGDPCHHSQTPHRYPHVQRMHRMDGPSLQMNRSLVKQGLSLCDGSDS